MKKNASILLLIALAFTLLACKKDIPEAAYMDFITQLEEMNFSVNAEVTDKDILQGERRWLTVNETEHITVYLYDSGSSMEKDASNIDEGGTGYHNGNDSVEISWVSYPHFYKTDNIIILYVGEDETMIHALEDILGDQFAGYQG
ncbi:hypothetical protein J3A84_10555 [Proteiniclasticum sp. SCR006]|uniref:DUF4367 domain-containing protein n=1 Tax=Proteiniclasticum aestuarii TaxID=2817862 RepID=A0A939H712_9CLOT|nr:hypothetical protein [Proteiniclasticum aestuarii]MBO1265472.1 hypothetical protein [Proteiniclasticum aestuarii]